MRVTLGKHPVFKSVIWDCFKEFKTKNATHTDESFRRLTMQQEYL
jgi:hypothetical protein